MNRYEQICQIGKGSFGVVYKCRLKQTGQFVALKLISTYGKSQNDLNQLQKEIDLLHRISHPNIIKFFESFEEDGNICIVTELAQTDLYEVISTNNNTHSPLPIGSVQQIGYQILQVLNFLHQQRIAHRDIKPQNVLVCDNNIVKLCDFGFARQMSSQTMNLQSIKGSPIYLAPEIASGKAYDFSSDVWSFGIMIYELSLGKPPFMAVDFIQLIKKLQDPNLLINFDYPIFRDNPVFKNFLECALIRNPLKRSTCRDLLNHQFMDPSHQNLLMINVQAQANQRDWAQILVDEPPMEKQDDLNSSSVSQLAVIQIQQQSEIQEEIFAEVKKVDFSKGCENIFDEITQKEPLFALFIDIFKNHSMIDSVFGSDVLKNAVNSLNDQYIQNDYEVLSLIKTEGVNRIFCNKTDFMLFIMVKKTTPILLILSEINCFKNSASNLASDKQIYLATLLRILAMALGSKYSINCPLIYGDYVSFPFDISFEQQPIIIPNNQEEKIQFTDKIFLKYALLLVLGKEKTMVDGLEICLNILESFVSTFEQGNDMNLYLVQMMSICIYEYMSFCQCLFPSFVLFIPSNKRIVRNINEFDGTIDKCINYDVSTNEIITSMMPILGKRKFPDYIKQNHSIDQDLYFFKNADILEHKQEWIFTVVMKLVDHLAKHLPFCFSNIYSMLRRVQNINIDSSLQEGTKFVFDNFVNELVNQMYSKDGKSQTYLQQHMQNTFQQLDLLLFKDQQFTIIKAIQLQVLQLFFALYQSTIILIPLEALFKKSINCYFDLRRPASLYLDSQSTGDEIKDVDFVLGSMKMSDFQLLYTQYDCVAANFILKQQHYFQIVASTLPFIELYKPQPTDLSKIADQKSKIKILQLESFFNKFHSMSLIILQNLFYPDFSEKLQYKYFQFKDKFGSSYQNQLQTILTEQQFSQKDMVNDEDISNQTILDYCHKLAESKRPRRGFNIYCQAQIAAAFDSSRNLDMPLITNFNQDYLNGVNVFKLCRMLAINYYGRYIMNIMSSACEGIIIKENNEFYVMQKSVSNYVKRHLGLELNQMQSDFLYNGIVVSALHDDKTIQDQLMTNYLDHSDQRISYLQMLNHFVSQNQETAQRVIEMTFAIEGKKISFITLIIISILWIPAQISEEDCRLSIVHQMFQIDPTTSIKCLDQDQLMISKTMGMEISESMDQKTMLSPNFVLDFLLERIAVYMQGVAVDVQSNQDKYSYCINDMNKFDEQVFSVQSQQGEMIDKQILLNKLFKNPKFYLSTGTSLTLPLTNDVREAEIAQNLAISCASLTNDIIENNVCSEDIMKQTKSKLITYFNVVIDTFTVQAPFQIMNSVAPFHFGFLDQFFRFLSMVDFRELPNAIGFLNKLVIISNLQFENSLMESWQSLFIKNHHGNYKDALTQEIDVKNKKCQLQCAYDGCLTCLYNLSGMRLQRTEYFEFVKQMDVLQTSRHYNKVFWHWEHLLSPQGVQYLIQCMKVLIAKRSITGQPHDQLDFQLQLTSEILNSTVCIAEILRILCKFCDPISVQYNMLLSPDYCGGQFNIERIFQGVNALIYYLQQHVDNKILYQAMLLEYGFPTYSLQSLYYMKNSQTLQFVMNLLNFQLADLPLLSRTTSFSLAASGALGINYFNSMVSKRILDQPFSTIIEFVSVISQVAHHSPIFCHLLYGSIEQKMLEDLFEINNQQLKAKILNLCGNLLYFDDLFVDNISNFVNIALQIVKTQQADNFQIFQSLYLLYNVIKHGKIDSNLINLIPTIKSIMINNIIQQPIKNICVLLLSAYYMCEDALPILVSYDFENIIIDMLKFIQSYSPDWEPLFEGLLRLLIINQLFSQRSLDFMMKRFRQPLFSQFENVQNIIQLIPQVQAKQ